MAGPQRIEWRRRWPKRALSNLRWYCAVAALIVGCMWLLFGGESARLETGGDNPLAQVPSAVTSMAVVGAVIMAIPVLFRPGVAADHNTLLIQTGFGRTLALAWAYVDEIAIATVDDERYLLVRCVHGGGEADNRPGWIERAPLRRLAKLDDSEGWDTYDLAVPMKDFVGGVHSQLTALAALAPDTVKVTFTG